MAKEPAEKGAETDLKNSLNFSSSFEWIILEDFVEV